MCDEISILIIETDCANYVKKSITEIKYLNFNTLGTSRFVPSVQAIWSDFPTVIHALNKINPFMKILRKFPQIRLNHFTSTWVSLHRTCSECWWNFCLYFKQTYPITSKYELLLHIRRQKFDEGINMQRGEMEEENVNIFPRKGILPHQTHGDGCGASFSLFSTSQASWLKCAAALVLLFATFFRMEWYECNRIKYELQAERQRL